MSTNKQASADIKDLTEKAKSAKKAAAAPDASEREKADSKLLEQKALGEKLRARHADATDKSSSGVDAKLDKALKDSFPGSDPVSIVQPAPKAKS